MQRRDPTETSPQQKNRRYTKEEFLQFYGPKRGAALWAEAEERGDPTTPDSRKTFTRTQFIDFYGPKLGGQRWREAGPKALELVYFNVSGLAEQMRLAFAYSGIEFTDTRLRDGEHFQELKAKGEFPLGQVPILRVGKGKGQQVIAQSNAILRYIARIGASSLGDRALYPTDPEAAARVDTVFGMENDLTAGLLISSYPERLGFGKVLDEKPDGDIEKRRAHAAVRRDLHDVVMANKLAQLAKVAGDSQTGWIANTPYPSIADFSVVCTIMRLRGRSDGPPYPGCAGMVERHPSLLRLYRKVMGLPAVKAYYKSKPIEFHRVPRMGFGTFNTWGGEPGAGRDEVVGKAVLEAVKAGYRHIDAAELYRNQASIGDALVEAQEGGLVTRNELFLCSKVWNHNRTIAKVREACVNTIKDLRTDYLDLFVLHWPVCWVSEHDILGSAGQGDGHISEAGTPDPRGEEAALEEAWKGMEALVEEGLVRQIGVSNFGVKRLGRLLKKAKIRPTVNQCECHPHLVQEGLLRYCKQQAIDFVAYCPIGNPGLQQEGVTVVIKEKVVTDIAAKHDATPAQVTLAWNLARGVAVIPKSQTPSRIVENFGALKVQLSEEEVNAISALNRDLRSVSPEWMPNWD